ncbi:hypothetical protein PENSPDRAFT_552153, partial [Peniophora sp. CONT]
LGTDWLALHNPEIDWKQSRVDMTRCPPDCVLKGLQLARVVPDIEHCTFEPGDVILFSTEYTEDTDDEDTEHALNVRAGFTHSQELAEKHTRQAPAKSFEELVPEQYRHWKKVFDKVASERLP